MNFSSRIMFTIIFVYTLTLINVQCPTTPVHRTRTYVTAKGPEETAQQQPRRKPVARPRAYVAAKEPEESAQQQSREKPVPLPRRPHAAAVSKESSRKQAVQDEGLYEEAALVREVPSEDEGLYEEAALVREVPSEEEGLYEEAALVREVPSQDKGLYEEAALVREDPFQQEAVYEDPQPFIHSRPPKHRKQKILKGKKLRPVRLLPIPVTTVDEPTHSLEEGFEEMSLAPTTDPEFEDDSPLLMSQDELFLAHQGQYSQKPPDRPPAPVIKIKKHRREREITLGTFDQFASESAGQFPPLPPPLPEEEELSEQEALAISSMAELGSSKPSSTSDRNQFRRNLAMAIERGQKFRDRDPGRFMPVRHESNER